MGFTLPKSERLPSTSLKLSHLCAVSPLIPVELFNPKTNMRLGNCCPPTPIVAMPEATVDENDFVSGREHQVGLGRESGLINAKSVTQLTYNPAYNQFGFCMLAANAAHQLATIFFAKKVHSR